MPYRNGGTNLPSECLRSGLEEVREAGGGGGPRDGGMDCRLDDGEEAGQLGAQSLPLLPGKDAMVFLGLPGLRRHVWGTRSCWQRAQSVLIPLMAEEDLHLHLGIPDALFKLVLSWTPPLDDTSQECQHLSAAYCPKCLCSHSFNSGSLPMNWVKSHFTDRRLRHKRGRERLSKSPQVT